MISLDFYSAVALYVFLFLSVILLIWVFAKKEKDKDLSLDPKFIWFCSICSYTYINTKEEVISSCPRCSSLNKKSS